MLAQETSQLKFLHPALNLCGVPAVLSLDTLCCFSVVNIKHHCWHLWRVCWNSDNASRGTAVRLIVRVVLLFSKLHSRCHLYFVQYLQISKTRLIDNTIPYELMLIWYGMIYLLTSMRLTPGGSSTVHIYTKTIHRKTQLTTLVGRNSGIRTQNDQTNWEECGPCPVVASYTLAFDLQLRKKHGETSVRVAELCQLTRWKQNIQNIPYITIRIHRYNNKNT